MKITYHAHALERMAGRGISRSILLDTNVFNNKMTVQSGEKRAMVFSIDLFIFLLEKKKRRKDSMSPSKIPLKVDQRAGYHSWLN